MYEFQLYKSIEDNFPTEIIVDGVTYHINADYRVILRIFKIQEQTDVSQMVRNLKTLQLFYGDEYPPENPFMYFSAFVRQFKEPESDISQPVMDYLHDADVIYTSVKMQYGINILTLPFLHWYEFTMLVNGLSEHTPLQERIRVRTMKLDGLKGEDLINARKSKKRVALPHIETQVEQQAILMKFGLEY